MTCPKCNKKIIGKFSTYKDINIYKNIVEIPMIGSCDQCDSFYTWNIVIDNYYNVKEESIKEFKFC